MDELVELITKLKKEKPNIYRHFIAIIKTILAAA